MAYSDYGGGQMERQPQMLPQEQTPQKGGLFGGLMQRQPPTMTTQPVPIGSDALGGQAKAMPPSTRADALQQVQNAYSAPTSYMPGNALGMYGGGLLEQLNSPVSAQDPNLRGILAAGNVADTRSIDRQRAALAERLGGQGLGDSGAMSTKTMGIQQRVGEAGAARDAGLLFDESQARRQALMQLLGMDQQRYSFDQSAGIDLARLEALLNQQATQPLLGY